MKTLFCALLCVLGALSAEASNRGYLHVTTNPKDENNYRTYQALKCKEFLKAPSTAENCKAWSKGDEVTNDKLTWFAPGIYFLTDQASAQLIEIKTGQITTLKHKTISLADLLSKDEKLRKYFASIDDVTDDLSFSLDYSLAENQKQAEAYARIKFGLSTSFDFVRGLETCANQTYAKIIESRKVRACNAGKEREVTLEMDREVERVYDLYMAGSGPYFTIEIGRAHV